MRVTPLSAAYAPRACRHSVRTSRCGRLGLAPRRLPTKTCARVIEGYDGKIPQTDSGLRTRRSELVKKGLLVDTGRRELLDTGRSSKVWGLPPRK